MKTYRHLVYRCPKCGGLTTRDIHCYVKGPPLFPQMDSYTSTEPVEVVVAEDVEATLRLFIPVVHGPTHNCSFNECRIPSARGGLSCAQLRETLESLGGAK